MRNVQQSYHTDWIPGIDAMKEKESAVCAFCLVEIPRIAADQVRKDADEKAFHRKFTAS